MHRTGQSGNRRKTMADISAEIKKFKDAVYGKDVRGSMISLAEKVNAETEKTTELAQDTSREVEGFNQRIEDNKNAVAKLRNDHNTDIASLTQNKADAIINTATGEHIAVGDSSGHLLDNLRIFGKSEQVQTKGYQLFDASKLPTKTTGGATVTNNGDGSFTISGSGNLTDYFSEYYELTHDKTVDFLKSGRISVKDNEAFPSLCAYLYYDNNQKFYNLITDTLNHTDITEEMLAHPDCRLRIYIYGCAGKQIKPGTIKPMLYQDGDGIWEPYSSGKPSPSPDYPQEIKSTGANGKIETAIHGGRNLFNIAGIGSKTQNGVTVLINNDQSFTITGTGSVNFISNLIIPHEELVRKFKPGTLKLKTTGLYGAASPVPRPYFCLYRSTESGNELIEKTLYHGTKYSIKQEYLEDKKIFGEIGFYSYPEFTTKEGTFKVMLYQDGDGTWEPFQPLQSLSLPTPNGLLGIPVESGGNYTDQNGQQWICDEIDLKRVKYLKHFHKITFDSSENWELSHQNDYGINNFKIMLEKKSTIHNPILLSTHFKSQTSGIDETREEGILISGGNALFVRMKNTRTNTLEAFKQWLKVNPVTVLYILDAPTETDIPQETLVAYKKLHSNYPSTVIQNDSGAGMELSYVADTKNYTDNKIKEAVSAQTQSLANLLSLMPLSTQAAMIETDTNNILDNMEVTEYE